MKYLYAILILLTAIAAWAFGDPPPVPATLSTEIPTAYYVDANGVTNPVIVQAEAPVGANLPPDYEGQVTMIVSSVEWELTFEWADNVQGTNAVPYPIKIQVPFEHDHGFVFIRAKKVLQ